MLSCGWEMKWGNDPHTCWTISAIVSCAPEKFSGVFNGIRSHDLCNADAVLLTTELWRHSGVRRSICWARVPVKGMMSERNVGEVWLRDKLKKWYSHVLGNLSNCRIRAPEKPLRETHEPNKLTCSALQRSWVRISLKTPENFAGAHETIAEIVQWVSGLFLQLIHCNNYYCINNYLGNCKVIIIILRNHKIDCLFPGGLIVDSCLSLVLSWFSVVN